MVQYATAWKCGAFTFDLAEPIIMGILNVTPDSFSDGGRYLALADAVAHAVEMHRAGAAIIDVGGESTRPGAHEVSPAAELQRVLPVVKALAEQGLCVSTDTRHAEVARACVSAGASIINDISGFCSPGMREVARTCDAGLVVMHMAGTPQTMQDEPYYDDVVAQVRGFLLDHARTLEEEGVARERICIDPGPGFGKTTAHNLSLIRHLDELVDTGYPVMAAVSRKRLVGELYDIHEADARTWPSVALALHMVLKGARVLRVHDVAQTAEALHTLEQRASRAIIAVGANMGDRARMLADACSKVDTLPYTHVTRMSSIYESQAAYVTDQPDFANAVIEIGTRLAPHVLLSELQRLEVSAGRARGTHNQPRPLDLDIIDYAGVVSADPQLTLPHPRALERDFVVTPLLEIDPAYTLASGSHVTRDGVRYGMIRSMFATAPAGFGVCRLSLDEVRRQIAAGRCTTPPGCQLYGGGVTTSTNDDARNLANAGAPDKSICLATVQTAGRGRLGRTWVSPPGGLYLSMVCRLPRSDGSASNPSGTPDLRRVPTLALAGGIAVLRAVHTLGMEDARLKWPNDILVPNGKLCGINIEMQAAANGGAIPVIGIGINVNRAADAFERSAFLSDRLGHMMLEDVASSIIGELCTAYERWKAANMSFAPFAEEYRANMALIGEQVVVRTSDGTVIAQGKVRGVDEEGHLLVGTTPVAAGEVTLR